MTSNPWTKSADTSRSKHTSAYGWDIGGGWWRVADGEVEEFMLLPVEKVADLVNDTTDFKDNCNLVVIDFLIRHGYLTPECPEYLHILKELRRGDWS